MKKIFLIIAIIPILLSAQNMDVLWNSEVENPEGEILKLEHFKGQIIYLDLWASWCLPCRYEFPKFEKLAEEYKNKPIHFVGLSVDFDRNKWLKYLKKKEPSIPEYRYLPQSDKVFSKEFSVNGIPHFILINKDGTLYENNTTRPSEPEIEEILDKMLKQE